MCRKLICLASFVLLLSIAGNVSADLVGHWKLDDGSGTVAADSSGYGRDGTITNATWEAGKYGAALNFDGSAYVDIPAEAWSTIETQVTITFWAYGDPDAQPQSNVIVGAFQDPANNDARVVSAHVPWGNGDVYFDTGGTTAGGYDRIQKTATAEEYEGSWQHWALVKNADTGDQMIYLNGVLWHSGTGMTRPMTGVTKFTIGCKPAITNHYVGMMDDVRLYDHVLTEDELLAVLEGAGSSYPYVLGPDPADGDMLEATWVSLSWRVGDFAVSHDVYLGDNFEDVNDGAGDTFRGNQDGVSYLAGFTGFAYPDGLVNGNTYYWRIDEVNDADPNSPWKGPVWSFWIQPSTAYSPTPANGINFVLQDVTLNWTAGLGASLHQVYFGDNLDDVNDATGAALQQDTTYTPDTLELEKTYYWRVDEFDSTGATLKGDVWSFITVPDVQITNPNLMLRWTLDEGEGTTAVDWSGHGNHGAINGQTQWTDGYQGTALTFGANDYVEATGYPGITGTAARTLCAWIKTSSANRTIMSWGQNVVGQKWRMRSDATGGLRLEVNGGYKYGVTNIADGRWHHVAVTFEDDGTPDVLDTLLYVDGQPDATADSLDEPIDTDVTGVVRIGKSAYHTSGFIGVIDDARAYDKVLTAEEIQQVMLGDTKLAGNPVPDRGALVDIRDISSLSFSAGDTAASHDVYLGTVRDAVANATKDSPEFQGNQAGTDLSLAGLVEFGGGDYFWRIDEVEADETVITGTIWKFTVPDYLTVDNFEAYNAGNNEIWWSWKDGLGYGEHDNEPAYAGNGTGAAVGDETSPTYMEHAIVHGGGKSMPFWYDNNKQGYAKYSETELTLSAGERDWTAEGVGELSLWFRGESDNAAERLYVAVADTAVVYHDDPNAVQLTRWTEWVIPLQALADKGISLTDVDRIAIGLGTRSNATIPGGAGKMYIDDIALYRPSEAAEE